MAKTNAWLLSANKIKLALAQYELIEIITEPMIYAVPVGPVYCQNMLLWRDQLLPLIDLELLSNHLPTIVDKKYYIVVAWQLKEGEPLHYGALTLLDLPENIVVDDEWQTLLPQNLSEVLSTASLSCFNYDNNAIVIPDLKALYGEKDGE